MPRKKKGARALQQEVEEYLRDGDRDRGEPGSQGELFWPGGGGGGGSRRRRPGRPVVRPHRRTGPACKKCGVFHTGAEHRRHGDPPPLREVGATKTGATKAARKAIGPTGRGRGAGQAAPVLTPYLDEEGAPLTKRDLEQAAQLDERRYGLSKDEAMALVSRHAADYRAILRDLETWRERHGLPAQSSPLTRGYLLDLVRSRAPGLTAPSPVDHDPLAIVIDALRNAPPSARFGPQKVFISELYRIVRPRIRMSLPEFKQWLVTQHRSRRLVLARADLVAAMDPDLVAASETRYDIAQFHFVVDPSASPR